MAVVDGKIIVAKAGVTAAFINLGRKDMLQPGTIFRVLNKNSTVVKAYATVVRVEQDKAEVTLSEVRDPLTDAVREGDERTTSCSARMVPTSGPSTSWGASAIPTTRISWRCC